MSLSFIILSLTITPTYAINADLGKYALHWLVASVYIGNNASQSMDIARGDADAVIHKGFALADRVMKIRGLSL